MVLPFFNNSLRFYSVGRNLVSLILATLVLVIPGAAYGLDTQFPQYYKQLSGVWEAQENLVGNEDSDLHFSWGSGKPSQSAVIIELGGALPNINNTVQALAVKSIERVADNAYEITCLWVNASDQYDDRTVQIIVHVEGKDKIWIEWIKGESRSYFVGRDHPLYRTFGPK